MRKSGDQFQYGGPHLCAGGKFPTHDGKAHFRAVPLPQNTGAPGTFRLTTRRGVARFGMTPVNMTGGGIGWLYRELFKPGVLGQAYERVFTMLTELFTR